MGWELGEGSMSSVCMYASTTLNFIKIYDYNAPIKKSCFFNSFIIFLIELYLYLIREGAHSNLWSYLSEQNRSGSCFHGASI